MENKIAKEGRHDVTIKNEVVNACELIDSIQFNYELIGERLKELRMKHNFTQRELGEILYSNNKTYSKYETNQTMISVDLLYKLSKLYKVDMEYFLTPETEKKEKTESLELSNIMERFSLLPDNAKSNFILIANAFMDSVIL